MKLICLTIIEVTDEHTFYPFFSTKNKLKLLYNHNLKKAGALCKT